MVNDYNDMTTVRKPLYQLSSTVKAPKLSSMRIISTDSLDHIPERVEGETIIIHYKDSRVQRATAN
jgi:hypothetical protein